MSLIRLLRPARLTLATFLLALPLARLRARTSSPM